MLTIFNVVHYIEQCSGFFLNDHISHWSVRFYEIWTGGVTPPIENGLLLVPTKVVSSVTIVSQYGHCHVVAIVSKQQ